MLKGPKGEKRPADVIGAAIMVGMIATGELEDRPYKRPLTRKQAAEIDGKKRASTLTPKRRSEIAAKAAKKRWAVKS
jgi:hypothetical protein